jgi:hypothetical protein
VNWSLIELGSEAEIWNYHYWGHVDEGMSEWMVVDGRMDLCVRKVVGGKMDPYARVWVPQAEVTEWVEGSLREGMSRWTCLCLSESV